MAQDNKKVFTSFQELRQHFFPKQYRREQARVEVEAALQEDNKEGFQEKYVSPDYDPTRPVGGTNHPNRRGPNEPHPFRKD